MCIAIPVWRNDMCPTPVPNENFAQTREFVSCSNDYKIMINLQLIEYFYQH